MTFRPIALVAFLLVVPSLSRAAEALPKEVSSRLSAIAHHVGTESLKKVAETYERTVKDPKAIEAALKSGGLSDADIGHLRAQFGGFEGVEQLKVELEQGELILSADGQKIEIGPKEFFEGSMLINGRPFRWHQGRGWNSNFKTYDSLFVQKRSHTAWLWDALASDAHAGGHLSIQVAGLVLHFVTQSSDKLEALRQFDTEVNDELGLCLNQNAESYRSHVESKELNAAIRVNEWINNTETLAHFRNCGNITEYVYRAQDDAAKARAEASVPQLCARVNSLAGCMRRKYPASAQNELQRKGLRERGSDEWSGSPPSPRPTSGQAH